MRLIFTGDIMLGGDFLNKEISRSNFDILLFEKLKSANYIISNFENIIGKSKSIRKDKDSILYCTQKTFSSFIKIFPNTILCLGNNHINDFGDIGYNKTIKILEENKIPFYGAGYKNDVKKPFIIENKVFLIHFSTNQFFVNSKIAKKNEVGCCNYDFNKIKKIIESFNLSKKILIISFHWGYERLILPSLEQIELAHKLIDIGADLIIGHHPHIIQPFEIYKGKYIFYSLGNFFFPNFFRYRSGFYQEWSQNNNLSIIVQLSFDNDKNLKIEIEGLKFSTKKYKLQIYEYSKIFTDKISKIFNKIYNNNDYKKIFDKYLKKYYILPPKSTIVAFIFNFFTLFNLFKKNKYSYFHRIKKIIDFRKLKHYFKMFLDHNNWLYYNKKDFVDLYNFFFNFRN